MKDDNCSLRNQQGCPKAFDDKHSAGNINVVWMCGIEAPFIWGIYYSRSIDNGLSWSLPVKISNSANSSKFPSISTDSAGNIDVVWLKEKTAGVWEVNFIGSTR